MTVRRSFVSILVALSFVVLLGAPVSADQVFHSKHAPFLPLGESPLQDGFIEIIHQDGPIRFSTDEYVLNGAEPDTTYTGTVHLSLAADSTCAAPSIVAPLVTLTTNGSRNGHVDAVIPPSLIAALGIHDSIMRVYFTLTSATSAYTTACMTTVLD